MHHVRVGVVMSAAAVVLAAGGVSRVASAQSWANPASGSWFDPLNWSPQVVPTGAGATGTLGLSGAYDVTTTTNVLSGINMTNPAARLLVAGNSQLTLLGGSAINGQLIVNGNADYQVCLLMIGGPVTIAGNGSVLLNCSPSDPSTGASTSYMQSQNGGTLTIGANATVGGFGRIDTVPTINDGKIWANLTGRPVYVNAGTHQNNGVYRASNGAELRFTSASITQSGTGNMTPEPGGVVSLYDTSLTGGTVTSTATGRVQFVGVTPINGVTIAGGADMVGGCTFNLGSSGLTLNNGTLMVNSAASYNSTSLRAIGGPVAIGGVGTVMLNASPSDPATTASTASITRTDGAGSFVFGPQVALAGFGWINSVPVTVNGVMTANVDGRLIRMDGQTLQNNNTVAAFDGGTLLLNNVAINQSPLAALYPSGAGSSGPSAVLLNACTVTGGALRSNGAAKVHLIGVTGMSAAQLGGEIDLDGGANVILGTPSIGLNNATLLVNTDSTYSATLIQTDHPFTFTGSGTVRLNSSPSDPNATAGTAYLTTPGGGSFTFPSSVTLAGFGWVNNVPTVNNSSFTADATGYPLRISGAEHQNNGLYRALNGARLVLVNTTVTQSGGAQITPADVSSFVDIAAACVVNGGTVGGPGTLTLDGTGHRLNNVTVNRQLDLNGGGMLSTPGLTLANNAQIAINTAAGYAGTSLVATGAPTVLGGTGTIHLRASTSDPSTTAGTSDLRRRERRRGRVLDLQRRHGRRVRADQQRAHHEQRRRAGERERLSDPLHRADAPEQRDLQRRERRAAGDVERDCQPVAGRRHLAGERNGPDARCLDRERRRDQLAGFGPRGDLWHRDALERDGSAAHRRERRNGPLRHRAGDHQQRGDRGEPRRGLRRHVSVRDGPQRGDQRNGRRAPEPQPVRPHHFSGDGGRNRPGWVELRAGSGAVAHRRRSAGHPGDQQRPHLAGHRRRFDRPVPHRWFGLADHDADQRAADRNGAGRYVRSDREPGELQCCGNGPRASAGGVHGHAGRDV
ncbi:MAG: hypothetical protein QM783_11660 [Phycisphaerales bacterium]